MTHTKLQLPTRRNHRVTVSQSQLSSKAIGPVWIYTGVIGIYMVLCLPQVAVLVSIDAKNMPIDLGLGS